MNGASTARPSVALIGAGAIGLSIGAGFSAAGCAVTVCGGRQPIERIEVHHEDQVRTHSVRVINDPSLAGHHRIVVLAVKAYATHAVADWLRNLDHPDAVVLVAQNGVELCESVQPFISAADVVPSVSYLNAQRTAPGVVELRTPNDTDLVLPATPAAEPLAALLEEGGLRVRLDRDYVTTAWYKLLTNITANPITALTGRRMDVLRDQGVSDLAAGLLGEAIAVARAEGAELGPDTARERLEWMQGLPDDCTTSMREDRLAGRPLEYDALTGAVLRAGERHGIDVPVNRRMYALLAAIR